MEVHLLNDKNIDAIASKVRNLLDGARNKRIFFKYHENKFLSDTETFQKEIELLTYRSNNTSNTFIWIMNPEVEVLKNNRLKILLNSKQGGTIEPGALITFIDDYYFFHTQGVHLNEYRFTNE